MTSKKSHRPNEREYRAELDSIQRDIGYWSWHIEHGNQRIYSLIVEDLKERELLLKEALRRPALLPLSKELRNPFDLPPTPDEVEFLQTARLNLERRKKMAPIE